MCLGRVHGLSGVATGGLELGVGADDLDAGRVAEVVEVEERSRAARTAQHDEPALLPQHLELARDQLGVAGQLEDDIDRLDELADRGGRVRASGVHRDHSLTRGQQPQPERADVDDEHPARAR